MTGKKSAKKQAQNKSLKREKPAAKQTIEEEAADRWDELSQQRSTVESVIDQVGMDLLKHESVTGLSAGFKISGGKVVRPLRYALSVSVEVKRHEQDEAIRSQIIPKRIKGVETDVVATRYQYCSNSREESQKFHKNPPGGCAIAQKNNEVHWGTMGIVVDYAGLEMYLTNEHVSGSKGATILQPPLPTDPIPPGKWKIGTVFRTGSDSNREVDCAIIASTPGSANRKPDKRILGPDNGNLGGEIKEGVLGEGDEGVTKAFAVGAASGHQELKFGTVRKTRSIVKLPDNKILVEQIKVESDDGQPLVRGGDSGSLLFVREGTAAQPINVIVGLVVAEYEQDEGMGVLKQGLIANHFSNVRRSLSFKKLG